MKMIYKTMTLMTLSLLSACQAGSLNGLAANAPSVISQLLNQSANLARQKVRVKFYTKLTNQSLVPLVTDTLTSIKFNGQFSIDTTLLPKNKGLEQSFPFIEVGEHVIELSFREPEQSILVPITVPKSEASEIVLLVILSFDAQDRVKNVEVGYDLNQDLRLDGDMNIYRSNTGLDYLIYLPDGQSKIWVSPLNQNNTTTVTQNVESSLPVGSERDNTNPDNAPQPQTREKTASPNPVELPKLPEPKPLPIPVPLPLTH